ncbi:hypothetical protein PVK06_037002 [Gossypium arboreum]|uniref:Uncharacterized protein n=1 Tax=Gossypium arboreum TaxID=29729 RepID=A0ABR0NLD3_GOSAR|nr:hypothetical protein PVK06_037002 [Gossypium arboreum]
MEKGPSATAHRPYPINWVPAIAEKAHFHPIPLYDHSRTLKTLASSNSIWLWNLGFCSLLTDFSFDINRER